jgi:organic hydroperoxide reductase OsmC/OhrA
MSRTREYSTRLDWTGNLGRGTADYRAYSRNHSISAPGKPAPIPGSSDPAFRGDGSRYNPEDLLVAAVSACHMLWVLHLCADAGIVVTAYEDNPTGVVEEQADGSANFRSVTLCPKLTLSDPGRAVELPEIHRRVHELCCLARSVNFPVLVEG